MLVRGRAVAEVIAHLNCGGNEVAEPRELPHDLTLVVAGPVRKESLVDQHLLTDIPLDGQLLGGNGRHDVLERPTEGPLVDGQVRLARLRADVHVAARHRGGKTDLEARALRNRAFLLQPPEYPVGGARRLRVARLEDHPVGIDVGAKAEQGHLAQQLAVPLPEGEEGNGGIDLHGGVILEHDALKEDPAPALSGLSVRHPTQERSEGGRHGPEDRLGVGQGNAADEMCLAAPGSSHGQDPRPAV